MVVFHLPHPGSTVVFHLRVTTAPGPAGSVSHKLSAQTGETPMENVGMNDIPERQD